MKKTSIIAALTLVLILAGCGSPAPGAETSIDIDVLYNDIKDLVVEDLRDLGLTDQDFELEELPGYAVTDLKSEEGQWILPEVSADVEEGFIIKAGMLNADQIIVIKAAPGKVDAIKVVLETQQAAQLDLWQSYAPEQAVKVKDTIISVRGDFICYITYADAEGIEALFNAE